MKRQRKWYSCRVARGGRRQSKEEEDRKKKKVPDLGPRLVTKTRDSLPGQVGPPWQVGPPSGDVGPVSGLAIPCSVKNRWNSMVPAAFDCAQFVDARDEVVLMGVIVARG
jgi:hypothetical protein